MSTSIKATFAVDNWDEHEIDAHDDTAKVTRAIVTKTYSGDIDATSYTETVMAYAEDGTATFVGLERLQGTVAGRTGSLVIQHVGATTAPRPAPSSSVAPGSGTGALAGAAGTGAFLADPQGSVTLEPDFG